MVAKKPQKLYKYQSCDDQSLDNLRKQIIWFSKPEHFNDPFDSNLLVTWKPEEKEMLDVYNEIFGNDLKKEKFDSLYFRDGKLTNEFKKHYLLMYGNMRLEILAMFRNSGIACFAEDNLSILMWSHYAKGHKGFCLEFDAEFPIFERIYPVKYSRSFPVVKPKHFSNDPFSSVITLSCTKAFDWNYEKEWRMFIENGDNCLQYEDMVLTGIYLGCELLPESEEKIRSILKNKNTQIYKVHCSESEFRLEI